MDKIEGMDEIEEEFGKKFKKLSYDEAQELDTGWIFEILPIIEKFYGGYHPMGRNARKKKQRYEDYLYMYYVLHPGRDWDERYDQPIFAEAIKYANKRDVR